MLLNPFQLYIPKTLPELTALCRSVENFKLKAGGTFLVNSLKLLKRKGRKSPAHVISLSHIQELKGIEVSAHTLSLGASTTIADILYSCKIPDNLMFFKHLCQEISTTPIRNMATIGGNLTCRYTWTEMPAIMVALDAMFHFITMEDEPYTMSAESFFEQEAKTKGILTRIDVPIKPHARYAYQRVKKTPHVDIPLLSLLLKVQIGEGGRLEAPCVAINNAVAFAQRDKTLEAFLDQQVWTETLAQEAMAHLDTAIYDTRSADYKKHMARISLQRAIQQLKPETRQ